VSITEIGRAITNLWASIWDERVIQYVTKQGLPYAHPAMAVVFQPMLDALVAGVAYSIHPLTGRANQVLVNAVHAAWPPLLSTGW
jgi:rifampicin phosphotransferase